jgi:hypothetical protein
LYALNTRTSAGEYKIRVRNLVGEPAKKRPTEKTGGSAIRPNINIQLKESCCEDRRRLELAQDPVQLRALLSAVLNFLIGFVVICEGFGYSTLHFIVAFLLNETDVSDIHNRKNLLPSLLANYLGTLDLVCINDSSFFYL